jgi:hypothetical protein
MPFEDLEIITPKNQPPQATISYVITSRKKGAAVGDRKPKLTISIPTTLCGTSKAKSFKLQIGTGSHLGKLRIVGMSDKPKAPAAVGVEPSEHAHFFRWNFGFVPRLGEDTFEGEKRPVTKISDDEFEIDVPKSWFNGASAT